MNRFLTIPEVATLFNVSKQTVARLIDKRKIAFYSIGGTIRLSEEDVNHYLEGHKWDWSKHPNIHL